MNMTQQRQQVRTGVLIADGTTSHTIALTIFAIALAVSITERGHAAEAGGAPSAPKETPAKGSPERASANGVVGFRKHVLTEKYFCDGATLGDIDNDGHVDVVAGPFWYAGPGFEQRHAFYKPVVHPTEPSPTDSMFSFVHDFDGDGWRDILVLGRVHKHKAYWYRNPGNEGTQTLRSDKPWKKHVVFERVRGESPDLVDIDADGKPELICHWENRWGWIEPDPKDPTKPWRFVAISPKLRLNQFYHGQGVGDVNGDGRLDLILNEGWYEQPPKGKAGAAAQSNWLFHRYRFGNERGGAQMFAYDVDGDGDNDIVTAVDAHGWGLAWFEHRVEQGGAITFKRHDVMGSRAEEKRFGVAFSQPHALAMADIDGDGLKDIIVGKRRWAHGPKGDVEPNAEPVVYWFQLVRDAAQGAQPKERSGRATFRPHRIDAASGVGVQVTAGDADGDGRVDVVTASKLGTFLFLQPKGAR